MSLDLVDLDAELFLLRACYARPALLDADGVAEALSNRTHRRHYDGMRALHDRGIAPDLVTLRDELGDGADLALLAKLSGGAPVGNFAFYSGKVRNLAQRRAILGALETLGEAARDVSTEPGEALDTAMAKLSEIEAQGRTGETMDSATAMHAALAEIEKRYMDKTAGTLGVPSGLSRLDKILDGFRPGGLYLLGARPSIGKTALAVQIADYAAVRHKLPVSLISLEMTVSDLQLRLLASRTGIPLGWLQRGDIEPAQWADLVEVAAGIAGAPLSYYVRRGATVADIRAWARQQKRAGMRLLIVDYLGLIRHPAPGMSLYQQVSQTSAALKTLALELSVPVLCLVQLSRAAADTRPTLAHLRDSGTLEQDADVVLLLHRTEDDGEMVPVDLEIAKHRNGPTARLKLRFKREAMLFAEEVGSDGLLPVLSCGGGVETAGGRLL